MLDPEVTEVVATLGEIAARNTAGAIQTRIKTARSSKQNDAIINELVEIINQVVDDRGQLLSIARALEEKFVAQRISAEEIQYITETLIPTVERLMTLSGDDDDDTIDALKAFVSVETLTVLQLVGFNFKEAIGEPLTKVVEGYVLKLMPGQATSRSKGGQRTSSKR